jgi:hypothetical protein
MTHNLTQKVLHWWLDQFDRGEPRSQMKAGWKICLLPAQGVVFDGSS